MTINSHERSLIFSIGAIVYLIAYLMEKFTLINKERSRIKVF